MIFNFYTHTLVKTDKSIAEIKVGSTKFFLVYMNIEIQIKSTKILIINDDSDKTPAGKIIILPRSAAKVEYATQLNH